MLSGKCVARSAPGNANVGGIGILARRAAELRLVMVAFVEVRVVHGLH